VRRTPVLAALYEHRADGLQNAIDQVQQRRQGMSPDGANNVSFSNYALLVVATGR